MPSTRQLRKNERRKQIAKDYRLAVRNTELAFGTAQNATTTNPINLWNVFKTSDNEIWQMSKRSYFKVGPLRSPTSGTDTRQVYIVGLYLARSADLVEEYPNLLVEAEVEQAYRQKRLLMWKWIANHKFGADVDQWVSQQEPGRHPVYVISIPPLRMDLEHQPVLIMRHTRNNGDSFARLQAKLWAKEL